MLPLLVAVFVVATCGLIYELVIGSLASYLLGDSVTQFSTVIGVYLFAMGVGSYMSRFIRRGMLNAFVHLEIWVGLVGGLSAPALYYAFAFNVSFYALLYGSVFLIGLFVGMEIPILLRILKDRLEFQELIARVLALDYVGALAASLLFPIVLVPTLGLLRSSLLFGALNVAVAIVTIYLFRQRLSRPGWLAGISASALVFLVSLLFYSETLIAFADQLYYGDPVVMSTQSRYQKIVVTRYRDDVRLYLNSHLQFSSSDEKRYHESLVYPAGVSVDNIKNVLVLGGGDGMAVRELLKLNDSLHISLVDLDPAVTVMFSNNEMLSALNQNSLKSARVSIINDDAFKFLEKTSRLYDLVVIDLPDPSNYSLGKLYSKTFFDLLRLRLNHGGLAVMQNTSPYFARKSYWCVIHTAQAAGFHTVPYSVYVPSFGPWGFFVMGREKFELKHDYPDNLAFLNREIARSLFVFSADMNEVETEINLLNDPVLVRYHEEEWNKSVR